MKDRSFDYGVPAFCLNKLVGVIAKGQSRRAVAELARCYLTQTSGGFVDT